MEEKNVGSAALVVGSGGVGSHIIKTIRRRFPNKLIYVADKAMPADFNNSDINLSFIEIDLAKDNIDKLVGLNIDTLIFSAGIGRLSTFETFTDCEINKNFSINCLPAIKLVRAYYSLLKKKSDFYCAIITSIAGMIASPLYSIYSATKGALVRFIEAVNAELTYVGTKNRILNIAPGYIGGTGFHGGNRTEEQEKELSLLAEKFVNDMLDKKEVCIPKYDEVYARVLNAYHSNPSAFALDSLNYKLKSNEINNKPQIKVGYLTGTFDLFHIGHLNILRNAKKYCDKLVVGVHPDGKHKNKEVFIPLEERMEILRNIKYVDEVMVCTSEDIDAYPIVHFDYLFVGSDYKGTERFQRYEEYLADKDAKIIYLPYTTTTSSTHLRQLITDRLTEDKNK